MSEAELHSIKQRLQQGRVSKARRGALGFRVPTGYVRQHSGEITVDPDEQVQSVVRLIFRKFEELGTLNAVLHYLVQHDITLGIRARESPGTGELEWHRPNRMTLQNLLKHPIYAGAYAYGRRQVDPRRKAPGRPSTGRVFVDSSQWLAFIKDRVPAYISWEQYEHNLAQLQANQARAETRGAARNGAALLAGLVVCASCGCRLAVSYDQGSTGRKRFVYACTRRKIDYGEDACQQLAGLCLDAFVSQQTLAALEPATLALSLAAAHQVERERADLLRLWEQRRERAAYEVERARRQYHLVEPENRLVARQLERTWEEKLAAQQREEEAYHRTLATQPRGLTEAEQIAIRQLAANIPALWEAATTTVADRKEIIRQVVERVVVAVQGESERVRVTIDWVGGAQTEDEIVRPVARLEQLSYYPQLCDRVRQLASQGRSAEAIAHHLNDAGYRPPKRRESFGQQGIRDLLHRLGASTKDARFAPAPDLAANEWLLRDLAQAIGMPAVTLYNWIYRGWVTARREEKPPHRWIIWADAAELARLRQRHQRPIGDEAHRRWTTEAPTPTAMTR